MKKIFGLTALIFLLSLMNVSAESEIFISAAHTEDEEGKLTHSFLIRAELDIPDANTMLIVKNAENETVEINQAYADKNGNVTYSFPLYEEGIYSGFINTEEERIKAPFEFEVLGDYSNIADEFNGADEDNIIDIIDTNAKKLLFDTKFYTEEAREAVSLKMLDWCGELGVSDINEAFDKSIIETYLYGDFETEKKLEIINYYDSAYLGITNQEEPQSIYSSFLGFADDEKEMVFDIMEEETPGLLRFRDTFNETVVKVAFSYLAAEELDGFILSNLDYVEFDGYDDYTQAKRKEIILKVKKSGAGDIEGLIKAYKDAIKKPSNNTGGGSSGSSGSSSGSSGGFGGSSGGSGSVSSGGTVWVAPVVEEKKEDEQKTVEVKKEFTDMESAVWAVESVNSLYNKGILKGRSDGIFAPAENVTRAEFAVMIVNAFIGVDEKAECDFSDIESDDWCRKYVATAYSEGIIYGLGDGSFGKNTNITREDMATILHRVLSFKKALPNVEALNNTISDFDTVAEYAKNSVLMLSELKIISGTGNGEFKPKKSATRAEAAVMLDKAMEVAAK